MGKDPLATAVSRVAAASRKQRKGVPVTVRPNLLREARADLIAARLEKAIHDALDPAPPYEPIRDEDRARLAKLLDGGR